LIAVSFLVKFSFVNPNAPELPVTVSFPPHATSSVLTAKDNFIRKPCKCPAKRKKRGKKSERREEERKRKEKVKTAFCACPNHFAS